MGVQGWGGVKWGGGRGVLVRVPVCDSCVGTDALFVLWVVKVRVRTENGGRHCGRHFMSSLSRPHIENHFGAAFQIHHDEHLDGTTRSIK